MRLAAERHRVAVGKGRDPFKRLAPALVRAQRCRGVLDCREEGVSEFRISLPDEKEQHVHHLLLGQPRCKSCNGWAEQGRHRGRRPRVGGVAQLVCENAALQGGRHAVEEPDEGGAVVDADEEPEVGHPLDALDGECVEGEGCRHRSLIIAEGSDSHPFECGERAIRPRVRRIPLAHDVTYVTTCDHACDDDRDAEEAGVVSATVAYAPPIPRPFNRYADPSREYTFVSEGAPWLPGVTRVHRVRTVLERVGGRGLVTYLWCGQSRYDPPTAIVTPEDTICGTCEGRAIGAGQPSTLELLTRPHAVAPMLFSPRVASPGKNCPGAGTALGDPDQRLCFVCGASVKFRGMGGVWRSRYCLESHAPGAGLIESCIWHGWTSLVLVGEQVVCACAVGDES